MRKYGTFNCRQIFSLALSCILVFAMFSNAAAKKDHDQYQQPYPPGTRGVPLPGVGVPVPPPPGKHPNAPQKIFAPPRPHKDKAYTKHPPRPKIHREYYRDRHWKHWDKEYGRSPWEHHQRPRYGSLHHSLPRDSFRIFVGGVPFFYAAGVYFQSGPRGYVVVQPPIGTRIQVLPEGCSFFVYGGRRCYSCDDVFYEEMGSDYVVINRPPSYRIIADAGDEVEVDTNSLNIRTGPGLRYDTIGRLSQSDIVEVVEVEGDWYYVHLEDGNYGWIKREYTRIIGFKEDPKG